MHKKTIGLLALAFLWKVAFPGASLQARADGEKSPYPAMASLDRYLISDRDSEIELARSAAPASVSDKAEVLVLGRDGYTSVVKGENGFVCLVERSWGAATDFPEFWNYKVRSPMCVNAPAAKTYLPNVLLKTKLALAGKSKIEIAQALKSALDDGELPPLDPGAIAYMMSKRQYLNDTGEHWHPHLMWFIPGGAAKSWGANLPDSPIIASDAPEDRMTVFMVLVGKWSDGTPASHAAH